MAGENAIRPVALGRKNWLFAGVPKGADASAMLFSLMETAKANEIEPQAYLKYLFDDSPQRRPRKTCGHSCRSTWINPFSQAFPSQSRAKNSISFPAYRIADQSRLWEMGGLSSYTKLVIGI
jgi:hypothetical protein